MAILCPPEKPSLFKPLVFVEQISSYELGGFHPISIGDCFNGGRYKVLHKLGDGASSTVWLARDQGGSKPGRLVALKAIAAEAPNGNDTELTVLQILKNAVPPVSGVHFVDNHFFVDGPNGTHLFLVLPLAGPTIAEMLVPRRRPQGHRRLRADLARKVSKQLVTAVYHMHCAGVVHGDITTRNIMFSIKPHFLEATDDEVYSILGKPRVEKMSTVQGSVTLVEAADHTKLMNPLYLEENVVLGDFGMSYSVNHCPSDYTPGTLLNYFPPEAHFEDRASFEADVWELGCAIFEIRTGTELFSDYLGCPDDVLRQVVSMLGRLPDPWWEQFEYRSSWFSDDGEPKSMGDKFWEVQENGDITFFIPAKKTSIVEQLRLIGAKGDAPLADEEVMYEKAGVGLSEKEVELLGDLLRKMLKYRPEDRIGLREVLDHPWFGMSE